MTQNTSTAVMQRRSEPHGSLDEKWREVAGWPGYDVSDMGRVRSWKHRAKGRIWVIDRSRPPRILKAGIRNGYPSVILSEKGKKRTHATIHRLVLETFVSSGSPGMQAAHGNGDKTDNRLANLRWATPAENSADKVEHGTHQNGEKVGSSKLSWPAVESIRTMRANGGKVRDIAKKFGVCRNTVINITTNRAWIAQVVRL